MVTRRPESEIAGLKAQEAKDYCIELLQELERRSMDPLSPGEMQLEELQFELKLKEAEAEDNRQRELHEQRLKELELEIAGEKSRQAEANKRVDEVRQRHAEVIQQVANAQEKLSVQLERASREHNVRLQLMQNEHEEKSSKMQSEIDDLRRERDELVNEISSLADLQATAAEVANLRAELSNRQEAAEKSLKELDDKIEDSEFEKQKSLTRIKREQELAFAQTTTEHQKMLLVATTETVDKLLQEINAVRIDPAELEELKSQAAVMTERSAAEVQAIQRDAVEEFRRQFNITDSEKPIDVTELFYQQRSLAEENKTLEGQVAKQEAEIDRMRTHIEKESDRVAKAIEAARINIQNNIEPGVKR